MIIAKEELENLLFELIKIFENEIVEFKTAKTDFNFDDLGKYFSAISNEANLKQKQYGWLIFGVTDRGEIAGSDYRKSGRPLNNLKKEVADHSSERITFIEIYELYIKEKRVILFQIPAAVPSIPTAWKGHYYGRDGESLISLNIYEIEHIRGQGNQDWSKQIIEVATIRDLDKQAIELARENFKKKNSDKSYFVEDIDKLDDKAFLNKAKLMINGKVTRAALLLLGKNESDHLFENFIPQITWTLFSSNGEIKDYHHFNTPFLTAVDKVYVKIRNLRYRYMAGQMSLFPMEVDQYDQQLIREVLHNCIAHQNYNLRGRINIQEYEDKLVFLNEGSFIPGSIEETLKPGYTPPFYRNPFLANAMVNLNMIDTVAMGIRRIFNIQRDRFFPLPDYDLSEFNRVRVIIYGKIIDSNYTRLLHFSETMNIETVFLLDKVQKGLSITKDEAWSLKNHGLIEGRYPSLYVSYKVADLTDEKAKYIKNKGLDNGYYKKLILELIKKSKGATKKEIVDLLIDKLPAVLTDKQKIYKIRNLLTEMKVNDKSITTNNQNRRIAKWVLVKK